MAGAECPSWAARTGYGDGRVSLFGRTLSPTGLTTCSSNDGNRRRGVLYRFRFNDDRTGSMRRSTRHPCSDDRSSRVQRVAVEAGDLLVAGGDVSPVPARSARPRYGRSRSAHAAPPVASPAPDRWPGWPADLRRRRPAFRLVRQQRLRASDHAADFARQDAGVEDACDAPFDPIGYIGWAASPIRVTRPNVQRSSGSRSTMGYSKQRIGGLDQRRHIQPVEPPVGELGQEIVQVAGAVPVLPPPGRGRGGICVRRSS